jgi:acetyl-CoA synthetase
MAAITERAWARTGLDNPRVPPNLSGLNIAHEAVDRHVREGRGDRVALRSLGRSGERLDVTYADLAATSSQFAHALCRLGLKRGDPVFACCERRPELYVAALGALKRGAVFCPLSCALEPESLRRRLALGKARVLVTTAARYERDVEPVRAQLPDLAHVLIAAGEPPAGTLDMPALLAEESERYYIPFTDPEDPALLRFAGDPPTGVVQSHGAVLGRLESGGLTAILAEER